MMNADNSCLQAQHLNSIDHSIWLKSRLNGRGVMTSGRLNKELLIQEIKQVI